MTDQNGRRVPFFGAAFLRASKKGGHGSRELHNAVPTRLLVSPLHFKVAIGSAALLPSMSISGVHMGDCSRMLSRATRFTCGAA